MPKDFYELLLSRGADPNIYDAVSSKLRKPFILQLTQDGCTALHYAAVKKNLDVVFKLIDKGADVKIKDVVSVSP